MRAHKGNLKAEWNITYMLLALWAFQLWVEIQQTAEMNIPLPLFISIKKWRHKNDIEFFAVLWLYILRINLVLLVIFKSL